MDTGGAKLTVNQREIYRYLGLGTQEPDERTFELTENCLTELNKVVSPRTFSRTFPMTRLSDGTLDFTCFTVKSRDLARNLEGCEEVILFAATLGMGADFLIRRYSRIEMSRAVVMQAAAAAMIESYCDAENEKLCQRMVEKGMVLRPRFSPGYGDFALEHQRELCRVLAAEQTVGITLTESCLMVPSKSVTAVIGAARMDQDGDVRPGGSAKTECVRDARAGGGAETGCDRCGKTDCLYRRKGIT